MYIHTTDIHNTNAAQKILPFLMENIDINSVLDIGTGLGTWLNMFLKQGITDVLGVDGDYVNRDLLSVPLKYFKSYDLTKELNLQRKYSLVISLEVIEHIDKKYEDIFFQNIIRHGDTILFSGAIPGQGGQNHVNEQWQTYWINKFAENGFKCYDILRPIFWDNDEIEWWYRQNIFIFSKIELSFKGNKNLMYNVVSRELFEKKIKENIDLNQKLFNLSNQLSLLKNGQIGLKQPLKIFFNTLKNKFFRI